MNYGYNVTSNDVLSKYVTRHHRKSDREQYNNRRLSNSHNERLKFDVINGVIINIMFYFVLSLFIK